MSKMQTDFPDLLTSDKTMLGDSDSMQSQLAKTLKPLSDVSFVIKHMKDLELPPERYSEETIFKLAQLNDQDVVKLLHKLKASLQSENELPGDLRASESPLGAEVDADAMTDSDGTASDADEDVKHDSPSSTARRMPTVFVTKEEGKTIVTISIRFGKTWRFERFLNTQWQIPRYCYKITTPESYGGEVLSRKSAMVKFLEKTGLPADFVQHFTFVKPSPSLHVEDVANTKGKMPRKQERTPPQPRDASRCPRKQKGAMPGLAGRPTLTAAKARELAGEASRILRGTDATPREVCKLRGKLQFYVQRTSEHGIKKSEVKQQMLAIHGFIGSVSGQCTERLDEKKPVSHRLRQELEFWAAEMTRVSEAVPRPETEEHDSSDEPEAVAGTTENTAAPDEIAIDSEKMDVVEGCKAIICELLETEKFEDDMEGAPASTLTCWPAAFKQVLQRLLDALCSRACTRAWTLRKDFVAALTSAAGCDEKLRRRGRIVARTFDELYERLIPYEMGMHPRTKTFMHGPHWIGMPVMVYFHDTNLIRAFHRAEIVEYTHEDHIYKIMYEDSSTELVSLPSHDICVGSNEDNTVPPENCITTEQAWKTWDGEVHGDAEDDSDAVMEEEDTEIARLPSDADVDKESDAEAPSSGGGLEDERKAADGSTGPGNNDSDQGKLPQVTVTPSVEDATKDDHPASETIKPAAAADVEEVTDKYANTLILKTFSGKKFLGQVVPRKENEEWWCVVYEDGDWESMPEDELKVCIQHFSYQQANPSSKRLRLVQRRVAAWKASKLDDEAKLTTPVPSPKPDSSNPKLMLKDPRQAREAMEVCKKALTESTLHADEWHRMRRSLLDQAAVSSLAEAFGCDQNLVRMAMWKPHANASGSVKKEWKTWLQAWLLSRGGPAAECSQTTPELKTAETKAAPPVQSGDANVKTKAAASDSRSNSDSALIGPDSTKESSHGSAEGSNPAPQALKTSLASSSALKKAVDSSGDVTMTDGVTSKPTSDVLRGSPRPNHSEQAQMPDSDSQEPTCTPPPTAKEAAPTIPEKDRAFEVTVSASISAWEESLRKREERMDIREARMQSREEQIDVREARQLEKEKLLMDRERMLDEKEARLQTHPDLRDVSNTLFQQLQEMTKSLKQKQSQLDNAQSTKRKLSGEQALTAGDKDDEESPVKRVCTRRMSSKADTAS